jgi:Plasmid encoded RepA protein
VQEGAQGNLWEERVVLDEMFWKALREHPVPLQDAAIRELRDRSMSLDIYVWLAWRLHTLTKAPPVSWPAIHAQLERASVNYGAFDPASPRPSVQRPLLIRRPG